MSLLDVRTRGMASTVRATTFHWPSGKGMGLAKKPSPMLSWTVAPAMRFSKSVCACAAPPKAAMANVTTHLKFRLIVLIDGKGMDVGGTACADC